MAKSIQHPKIMSIPETYEDAFKRVKDEINRTGIKCYTSEDINQLTSNLSESRIVGHGGYGVVYRGKFHDTGEQVAIKKLKNKDIVEESVTFMAEVSTMSSTSHKNLIKLKGYCFEPNLKALVYEFMEKGSLDNILYKSDTSTEWESLYRIAIEIAHGLMYLHDGANEKIIHYDIKAGNVLLDNKFSPKIADFGLAKLIQRDVSGVPLSGIRGTQGYTAPELYSHGFSSEVTEKCDVYSFGMLLFEILGKRNINVPGEIFPEQVWFSFDSGQLEDLLDKIGITKGNRENAIILSKVALLCIQFHPKDRPTMKEVWSMLDTNKVQRKPAKPNLNWKHPSASSMTSSMSKYQLSDDDFSGTSSGSNARINQGHEFIPIEGLDEGTKIKFTFENGDIYEGTCKNGFAHGKGKMWCTNGDQYEGEYKDGFPDGLGIFTYEYGVVYEGAFKEGKGAEGKGKMWWTNGNKYEGEFKDGSPDGLGIFTYEDGVVYEGAFKKGNGEGKGMLTLGNGNKYIGEHKNGAFDGQGTYVWKNGNKYEGDFKNGIREGKGEFHFADGNKYIGEYKNGAFDGHGTYVWKTGNKYEGDFKNGKREGKGEYHCVDGHKYTGEYKNDSAYGYGKATYKNGNKYEGDFKNGNREGKGEFHYANGDKYIGEFKNDKRDGRGTFVWRNGDKYEGDFKNRKKDGHGKFTYINGDVYEGAFKKGNREGKGMLTYGNGNKYEGDYINDAADGHGKFTYINGSYHRGSYKNDLADGEGIFVEANGMWRNGEWIQGIEQLRNPYKWNQL